MASEGPSIHVVWERLCQNGQAGGDLELEPRVQNLESAACSAHLCSSLTRLLPCLLVLVLVAEVTVALGEQLTVGRCGCGGGAEFTREKEDTHMTDRGTQTRRHTV